ncbi:hypothetical protein BC628DRAFT_136580 [Trametes gibbosa]|nr:hypothetical protein BC628DRAFT_136580 [Trametes gibbosa]
MSAKNSSYVALIRQPAGFVAYPRGSRPEPWEQHSFLNISVHLHCSNRHRMICKTFPVCLSRVQRVSLGTVVILICRRRPLSPGTPAQFRQDSTSHHKAPPMRTSGSGRVRLIGGTEGHRLCPRPRPPFPMCHRHRRRRSYLHIFRDCHRPG